MDKRALTTEELIQFFKDMELGTEQTIMAIDGAEDDIMPDLAMGVIKEKYFDSNTTTYLVGVYGDDNLFQAFFSGDYDNEDTCIDAVVNWFESTGMAMCSGNYGGLYIKSTDEEEQTFYEENKYNGEIARTIDTLEWGEVDMVARFDADDSETFYDCYQKNGVGYLGEFHIKEDDLDLDDYTDEEIENYLEENMETGW